MLSWILMPRSFLLVPRDLIYSCRFLSMLRDFCSNLSCWRKILSGTYSSWPAWKFGFDISQTHLSQMLYSAGSFLLICILFYQQFVHTASPHLRQWCLSRPFEIIFILVNVHKHSSQLFSYLSLAFQSASVNGSLLSGRCWKQCSWNACFWLIWGSCVDCKGEGVSSNSCLLPIGLLFPLSITEKLVVFFRPKLPIKEPLPILLFSFVTELGVEDPLIMNEPYLLYFLGCSASLSSKASWRELVASFDPFCG